MKHRYLASPVLVQRHDVAHRLTFAIAESIARFSMAVINMSVAIWSASASRTPNRTKRKRSA